jgi:tetratricopeptide (TPR) repeat protein
MQLYCESLTAYKRLPTREVKIGNLQKAKELAWEGIKQASNHPALWTVAGQVEYKLGNPNGARKIFQKAIAKFPK